MGTVQRLTEPAGEKGQRPTTLTLVGGSLKKARETGVLVPSGDRSGPTEAAAEKRPAFPERWGSEKVVSRKLGCELAHAPSVDKRRGT